ncbi:DCC1-like thiol-disulfide oxidoreductase family protein [Taklimakanibacter deserti]|uniref:DCC1-like thiol-disulfide oxidoreductase family protein n=1 Tax=Taklimakanibacter deserti TaxID=2267839 RepID=UPI000E64DF52
MKETPQIVLVYDRECPVCAAYCKALAIRQLDQNMQILNAREDHPEVREIKRRGLDLDEGFVLRIGTEYHHGAEAIHRLALISTSSGTFNRLNYLIFRSQTLSRLLYPVLRLGRNVLLAILGRSRISAEEPQA